jgi:hypothetical protein
MTSALRDARDLHGWTLEQTAVRLLRLAESRGTRLSVSTASLRQMISDMERGRRKPGHYAPLLCDLLGKTPEELGWAPPPQPVTDLPVASLEEMVTRAASVDDTTVEAFQQQVEALRLLDRQLGSTAVVEQTSLLVASLDELMTHVLRERMRSQLAAVLSDAAALNGWQLLNAGAASRAWKMHQLARTAGRESGRRELLAHAMGEQAYDLLDMDRAADALHLVQAAREEAGSAVPEQVAAWLHAVEAELHATLGDDRTCRRSLDQAEGSLPDVDDGTTPYISLNAWHLERWRGNILAKLGDESALDSLLRAVEATPATFVRAAGYLHCDIAQSYAARGDRVSSLRHANQARELARRTGSVRQLRRIDLVTRRLA